MASRGRVIARVTGAPDPGRLRRMMDRAALLALLPHQGQSCLLDRMERCGETDILCRGRDPADPAHPLRRVGRLHPIHGAEYGMQAAALHGAVRFGARGGYLVALRSLRIEVPWLDDPGLDDPEHGGLRVLATLEAADDRAMSYGFRLEAVSGRLLMGGRGTVRRA